MADYSKVRTNRGNGKGSPRLWQIIAAVFMLTTIGLLVGVIYLVVNKGGAGDKTPGKAPKSSQIMQDCQLESSPSSISDKSSEVFAAMTSAEYDRVLQHLLAQSDLDLSQMTKVTALTSNTIYNIQMHMPPKKEILAYLDGTSSKKPRRQALATVLMGKLVPPTVREYLVQLDSPMSHSLYTSPSMLNPIPWNSRPMIGLEWQLIDKALEEATMKIDFIMKESYSYTFHNCTYPYCLKKIWPIPMAISAGDRRNWVCVYREESHLTEGYHYHQLPIFIELYHGGTNHSNFKVSKIFYNKVTFHSVDELINKYKTDPNFREVVPMPTGGATYGSPERRSGKDTMADNLRPPLQYQPNGRRFSVNSNKVEYLGWISFNVHIPLVGALQIMNIRQDDKLVAFELSLQDISVLYSSEPPSGFFLKFFDTSWSLGMQMFPLIRDVDCPPGAIYLDTSYLDVYSEKPTVRKDVVCVFEMNTGRPLRRHFSSDFGGADESKYSFAFSMPDTVLIVRAIYTVLNYDHMIDYIFHQNGAIEARISPTGYMYPSNLVQSDAEQNHYGTVLNASLAVQAPMHHHIYSLKVDTDVLGTKNRFKTLDITPEYVKHPYLTGEKFAMNKFVHSLKKTEQEALIQYDFNKPKYYVMYNNDQSHSNGNKRGWKIDVKGFSKLLLPEDSMPANSTGWYRNQITVTKHKDNEQTTANIYRQWDVHNPVFDFKKFYEDNEGIVDEDLVAWVTVGFQHIPGAEDVPVTTTAGKFLSVFLQPYNYYEEDRSFHSRDGVLIRRNKKDHTAEVQTYFNENDNKKCMPISPKPDLRVGGN